MAKIRTRDRHLLFVSTSAKVTVGHLRRGGEIERQFASRIDQLVLSVCSDRYRLAAQFLKSAKKMHLMQPAHYRAAISRAYYAMYHAARAVTYLEHGGDDHEAHTTLSQNLPTNFPNFLNWRNSLREARLLRNKADYDPYPRTDRSFSSECGDLIDEATDFLKICGQYLRARGCTI